MGITNFNREHRRGLSSVVGAVFMILVMIGALNVALLAIKQQDKVTQAVVEKSNSNVGKLNEAIKISEVRVTASNKLNMTVTNTGGATAKLVSVYIVNETASPKVQYRYDLNNIPVDGRVSVPNVGSNLALTIKNNMKYSVKVVTAAGNSATTGITPISQVALPMSLTIIPPTVVPGANVTVLFTVTNNLTDYNLPVPLTPTLSHTLSCSPVGTGCQFIDKITPSSQTIQKGSTAIFQWVTWVNGPDGTVLTFNASLTNAKPGNFVITKSNVQIVTQAQGSFQAEQIVGADLLVKPEVFPIFPGPFGESTTSLALWGVSIANPVNQTMKVSRVVFTLTSPDAQGNQYQLIFPNASPNCGQNVALQVLYPSHGTWTCPGTGIMMWRDTANPEQIAPYTAQSFLVRVQPGIVASDEPAFITGVTVFTSYGQFAKTGYAGNMRDNGGVIGNVYLTNTQTPATALISSPTNHMFGNMSSLRSGVPFLFNVTLADLDSSTSTKIKSGATLIVNVPQGFTNVNVTSSAGFTGITKKTFTDGSTHIEATLVSDLGGPTTSPDAKILSFKATPPAVVRPTVFLMHTLTDGVTTDATPFSVDAFGGFALVVRP